MVLAPMAGITNVAFRTLCRSYGSGLFVSEMITSRALLERNATTMRLVRFGPAERPRSLQLYGVDPVVVGDAVRMVVAEDLADHVDLNFGCPVPKVTRRGGGAALPWKRRLFASIVTAAVRAADGAVPVTVKMRVGIDDEHQTYLEAGKAAQDAGAAWVALHGRTAVQRYAGRADWAAIGRLVTHLDIPVLGNGDVWEAADARRMVRETGCAGVVVGRGCLGRPWLFADLDAAFRDWDAEPDPTLPTLGVVATVLRRHAELLVAHLGDERAGVTDLRKHVAWYCKGFSVPREVRVGLATASTLAEVDALLGRLDPDQPYPREVLGTPRGRTSGATAVALLDGWLADRDGLRVPVDAELPDSGG